MTTKKILQLAGICGSVVLLIAGLLTWYIQKTSVQEKEKMQKVLVTAEKIKAERATDPKYQELKEIRKSFRREQDEKLKEIREEVKSKEEPKKVIRRSYEDQGIEKEVTNYIVTEKGRILDLDLGTWYVAEKGDLEEVKTIALMATLDGYFNDFTVNFSDSKPAEIIFVKDNDPKGRESDFYLSYT